MDEYYDPINKHKIRRWTLMLPGAGCSWSKQSGGCTMCGFSNSTKKYSKGKILPTVFHLFLFKMAYKLIKTSKPNILSIYVGGNFLNSNEISLKTQLRIFKNISKINFIERVFIESRPEFINEKNLIPLLNILKNKKIEIGIGLECQSDEIRLKNIHKGFTKKDFEESIEILKKLKIYVLTYIFLKPLFLSEKDSIKETIDSIKYANDIGVDEIVVEAALIQENTPMYKKYLGGNFNPPWLWSLLEVAKNTQLYKNVRFGKLSDEPTPIAIPRNCEICSEHIYELFEEYNLNPDITVFNDLKCSCKKKWEKEVLK